MNWMNALILPTGEVNEDGLAIVATGWPIDCLYPSDEAE